jgi:hypothetical protein
MDMVRMYNEFKQLLRWIYVVGQKCSRVAVRLYVGMFWVQYYKSVSHLDLDLFRWSTIEFM